MHRSGKARHPLHRSSVCAQAGQAPAEQGEKDQAEVPHVNKPQKIKKSAVCQVCLLVLHSRFRLPLQMHTQLVCGQQWASEQQQA